MTLRAAILLILALGVATARADGAAWGGERFAAYRDPPAFEMPTRLSAAAMHDAVRAGVDARKWSVVDDKPGHLVVKYDPGRDFWVTAAIDYDVKQVHVGYLDSQGLSYHEENGQRMIHPNVAGWMDNLVASLKTSLLRAEPLEGAP